MEKYTSNIVIGQSDTLLEGLNAICEKAKNTTLESRWSLLEALDSEDISLSSNAAIQLNVLAGQSIRDLIIKDPRFPGESVKFIHTHNGSCGFYPYFVGNPLIRRALQTNSPEGAILWLQKVLGTKSATGKIIDALWGVLVEEEITLGDGVKLVPVDRLPDSLNKRWIAGDKFEGFVSNIASPLNFQPVSAALVIECNVDPFIHGENDNFSNELIREEQFKENERFKEVALALTAVGPRVVLSAAKWFTFDDPDLEQANMLSGGRSMQLLEILPRTIQDYPILNGDEARAVVSGYLKLAGESRDKVRIALQRLSQALRRHNVGDRAVELATGLEALFGDSGNSEMTHKIRVRTARLVGGDQVARKVNADIIKRTYEIRSKLVHTGHVDLNKKLDINGQKFEPEKVVNQAIEVCAQAIKIVIRTGSVPDWDFFDINEHCNC